MPGFLLCCSSMLQLAAGEEASAEICNAACRPTTADAEGHAEDEEDIWEDVAPVENNTRKRNAQSEPSCFICCLKWQTENVG